MIEVHVDFFIKLVGWPKQDYYVGLSTHAILDGKNSIFIPKEDYKDALSFIKTKTQ